jgi:hypothetical protein
VVVNQSHQEKENYLIFLSDGCRAPLKENGATLKANFATPEVRRNFFHMPDIENHMECRIHQ